MENAEDEIRKKEDDLYALRALYDEAIERRIKKLRDTRYFETAVPDQCDNPAEEIDFLEEKLSITRRWLAEKNPGKYAFGKKLKKSSSKILGREVSYYGDEGFYVCLQCHCLFQCLGQNKEEEGFGRHKESFSCCAEHKGRKKVALLTLKEEGDFEL